MVLCFDDFFMECKMEKKFSRKLYHESKPTEHVVCDFLVANTACELVTPLLEQKERFKECDFELEYQNQKVLVEVEWKKVWNIDGKWMSQWDTIDVPYRKRLSKANLFVMVNQNYNTLAVIPMKEILASPVQSKNTIYTKGEYFFNVPVKKWIIKPVNFS